MSLLVKGISDISQLRTPGMHQGDIIYRGSTGLTKLSPRYGAGFNFLKMTNESGVFSPSWEDIQDIVIYLTGATNRAISLPTLGVSSPAIGLSTVMTVTGESGSAKELAAPDAVLNSVVSETAVSAVGGAISHNDDVGDTDESTEANDATPDDMTLLPADGAIGDYYAFGQSSRFDGIVVNVGVAGSGITLAYEYSRGGGDWGTLAVLFNEIGSWTQTGKRWFSFQRPADWAMDTLEGLNRYWIRFRAQSIGAGFVQPLGTQAWILTY